MSNAPIQKAAAPNPSTLGGFLALRKQHLAEVLPKSSALTAEKLIKLALLAARKNTALTNCSMDTVFQSLLQCAELGLDPGGSTGEAYLVPYGTTCTLIIGFRGYITLARRSGVLKQIETHIVRERDRFTLKFGLNPVLDHEPLLKGDAGAPVLAYCVARLGDGAVHVEVMTMAEIYKVRDSSKAKNNGPWVQHFDEMARKTVLRRAAKYLPLSSEMQRALEIEDENSVDGQVVWSSDAAPALSGEPAAPTQAQRIKQAIKAKAAIVDVEPGETEEQAEQRQAAAPPPPEDAFAPEAAQ